VFQIEQTRFPVPFRAVPSTELFCGLSGNHPRELSKNRRICLWLGATKLYLKRTMTVTSPSFDHSNPLTTRGVRLTAESGAVTFQVHECGLVVIGKSNWNFQQVVSPFWRLYYNASPGCAVMFRRRRIALGPNRAVIIPERVQFDCAANAGAPHLWLHFSINHPLAMIADAPLVLNVDDSLRRSLRKLQRAIEGTQPRATLLHLCTGVLHLCVADLGGRLMLRPMAPRLRALLEFIDLGLASPFSNDGLAARSGLSTGAFVRWFRRETGATPAAYVTGRRLREACRQLAFTDATIDGIAAAVGFADRHHFSRVFKQRIGCGPASFRKGKPGSRDFPAGDP
jgi:AraC-like DNA-binding protein